MQGTIGMTFDRALLDQSLLETVRQKTDGRFMLIENPAFLPLSFFLLIAPGESLANLIAARRLWSAQSEDTEMRALCAAYYRNIVVRNDGVRTYHYSAAVERRRLALLEETIRESLPGDVLKEMQAYRDAMLELRKQNRQPFSEVRDKEYLPFMLDVLKRKHPHMHLKIFADLEEVSAWLRDDLDEHAELIGLVNAGNHIHQCALSLGKGAGKASLIVLDSIHWTWNWHWKDDCTRKMPAPGYKAVLDFARVLQEAPAARGAYIPMNVQKSPMNCAIHGMHFLEQMHEHADFFKELHVNVCEGRLPHPLACAASPRLPYAREVSGLKLHVDSEVGMLLRLHGSAYRSRSGTWGILPWKGKGCIEVRGGMVFHDLGYGSYAIHLTSLLGTFAPEEELVTGACMSFTSENGSLETFERMQISAA